MEGKSSWNSKMQTKHSCFCYSSKDTLKLSSLCNANYLLSFPQSLPTIGRNRLFKKITGLEEYKPPIT